MGTEYKQSVKGTLTKWLVYIIISALLILVAVVITLMSTCSNE